MQTVRATTTTLRQHAAAPLWGGWMAAVACAVAPALCHGQQQPLSGTPAGVAAPAAGLHLNLGSDTHMVYEPKPWRPTAGQDSGLPAPQARLGLEFKSPSAAGPRDLLRVQLSGDAMLRFRPRAGGMQVSYRSQF